MKPTLSNLQEVAILFVERNGPQTKVSEILRVFPDVSEICALEALLFALKRASVIQWQSEHLDSPPNAATRAKAREEAGPLLKLMEGGQA